MKIITYLIVLFNVIAMIFSKAKRSKSKAASNSLSKSKSKNGQFIRRPFGYGRPFGYSGVYRPYAYNPYRYSMPLARPLVLSPSLLIPVSPYSECPANKGRKVMVGKSSGNCKVPCTMKSCIQISFECCIYGFPE